MILAAILPVLWWTGTPETVRQLKDAGVETFCVDSSTTSHCGLEGRRRAVTPGIDPKVNVASATRSPWINANAWRFRRNPDGLYVYEDPGQKSALALAEAFTYGVQAAVRTDQPRAVAMVRFLAGLEDRKLHVLSDVSFVDDGSAAAGEAMNLLSRRNILFDRVTSSDRPRGKVVQIGSTQFPKTLVANPSEFAYAVRKWIGDENRIIRIYGSENVLAYATGDDKTVRVHLLNYTANRVEGIRVRVRGRFQGVALKVFSVPDAKPADVSATGDATEFTVNALDEYAVVELKR